METLKSIGTSIPKAFNVFIDQQLLAVEMQRKFEIYQSKQSDFMHACENFEKYFSCVQVIYYRQRAFTCYRLMSFD